jgi:hypothetical protein
MGPSFWNTHFPKFGICDANRRPGSLRRLGDAHATTVVDLPNHAFRRMQSRLR